jgi:hypothetical protein
MKISSLLSLGFLAIAFGSCLNLNWVDCTKFDADPGGCPDLRAGKDGGPDSPLSSPNVDMGTGADGSGAPADQCPANSHRCGDGCVSNNDPAHCGSACVPCPTLIGGSSTCDGNKCGVQCPLGRKPCIDTCIDESAVCGGGLCPAGKNPCNDICVDASSVSACGPACVTCPVSANGQTSCDGNSCVLKCNDGFHACGTTCARNVDPMTCGTGCTPCPVPTGGTATCDGTMCGATCPQKTKLCKGACIDEGKACEGTCLAGAHDCNGNCVSDTDVANCGTSCMPCGTAMNAQATCDGKACGLKCLGSFKQCSDGRCVASSACCAACGAGTHCVNGTTCESDCKPGPCFPGGDKCKLGQIVCDGTPGGQCQQTGTVNCGAEEVCKSGTCVADCTGKKSQGQPCCMKQCNSPLVCNSSGICQPPCGKLGQACCTDQFLEPNLPDGQDGCASPNLCDGGKCTACGATDQLCCRGAICNAGNSCPLLRCRACGESGKACCRTSPPSCRSGAMCPDSLICP